MNRYEDMIKNVHHRIDEYTKEHLAKKKQRSIK